MAAGSGSGGGGASVGEVLAPQSSTPIGPYDFVKHFIAKGKTSSAWNFSATFPKLAGHIWKMGVWPVASNEPDADFVCTLTTQTGMQWSMAVPALGDASLLLPAHFCNGGVNNIIAAPTEGLLTVAFDDLENSGAAGQVYVEIWISTLLGVRVAQNRKRYSAQGETNNATDVTLFSAPLLNHVKENLAGKIKNNHSAAVTLLLKHDDGSTEREIWQDSVAADETLDLEPILAGLKLVGTTNKIEAVLDTSYADQCDFVVGWEEVANG